MALVNIKQHEVLTILKQDLLESMKNNSFVNVHIYSSIADVSHCVIPDEIIIEDYLMITEKHFEFNVHFDNVKSFELIQDEYEHSYYMRCDDMCIDFYFNT